jgi:hypothetical protein
MTEQESIVPNKITSDLSIHIPQRVEEIDVLAMKCTLNDPRVREGSHTILERGHVNISASK